MRRRTKPTIADVAARAGVSKGAVSFALNGRPGVGEDTRRRILEVAEELGWRPDPRAKAFSERRAQSVGLILARPAEQLGTDPYFGQLLAGIEFVLAERGYTLVLSVREHRADELAAYRQLTDDRRIDGAILVDPEADDPRFELLEELDLPAVALAGPGDDLPVPSVGADEEPAVRAAVAHLVDLGHRDIAHVSGPPGVAHAVLRREAWEKALHDAGLEPGRCITGTFSGESGAAATAELLGAERPPTAIFYAGDVMAIAGLTMARTLGVSVPRDLSIIGFDDAPLAPHVDPALTTIRQDPLAAGRAAATVLLDLLANRGEDAGREPLEPPTLIVRASTGPAPVRD
ncbi:MAG: LacI family DNA-binding transcriptional regulator [Actinomycetota bacterium]|nr:LacI family DNA-binding transcriptional regulator [Actinomycetota bacterium]